MRFEGENQTFSKGQNEMMTYYCLANVGNDDEEHKIVSYLKTEGKQLPEKWRGYNAKWISESKRTLRRKERKTGSWRYH